MHIIYENKIAYLGERKKQKIHTKDQVCAIKIPGHAASNARDEARSGEGLGVTEKSTTKSVVVGRTTAEGSWPVAGATGMKGEVASRCMSVASAR